MDGVSDKTVLTGCDFGGLLCIEAACVCTLVNCWRRIFGMIYITKIALNL